MGFPSPATDYTESSLSLDAICNTRMPSVFLFKSDVDAVGAGIKRGAVLIVNRTAKPQDGSIIAASLAGQFRLVRYRTMPTFHLEELNNPGRRIPLTEDEADSENGVLFGVITHVLNDMRVLDR